MVRARNFQTDWVQAALPVKPLLLLIDGHAVVHRAWAAIRQPLTIRATGEEVQGVYGFLNAFLKAISNWNPTYCAITFDPPGPTFRHEQYKAYKAQRPETPLGLRAQFPRVRQVMAAFGVPMYEVPGFEADDALGTLCYQAEAQGLESLILTGDTDTLQLVTSAVRVQLHSYIQREKVYDVQAVQERYGGLDPLQQPDIKALQGDVSDNIPGVPGVGAKTAIKLILEFGGIEALYEHLDEVEPIRIQELLRSNKEQAFQGKELTTIRRDVPLELDLTASRFGNFARDDVLVVLRELEFSSMVTRIPMNMDPTVEQRVAPLSTHIEDVDAAKDYQTIDTVEALETVVSGLRAAGKFAFDTETTGTDPMNSDLVGISFSASHGVAYYVPLGHREGRQIPLQVAIDILKPLFEDHNLVGIAHKATFDLIVLRNNGIKVANVLFDTMVAAQITGHNTIGLKQLSFQLLNEEMTPISELIGRGAKQTTMANVPIADATRYAAADADMTSRLHAVLQKELRSHEVQVLFDEVEMPLVPVLVLMQCNGIAVDSDKLQAMSSALIVEVEGLATAIYQVAGEQFNINSTQQLGRVLFEKLLPPAILKEMGLPAARRTKTGYSTDAAALEELKGSNPIVELVLRFRELSKLKSTYLDALPDLVNPNTGRIHTNYNQVGSATGRFSSSDPNLQNIPVRTELGKEMRRAFLAKPGWQLLAADYSQVELRVLAHLSKDTALIDAFLRDEDIHVATAAQVYGVPLSEVKPDMRRLAKVMNFGIIYGLSPHGISQQTGLDLQQGAAFIDSYLGRYPGIRDYINSTKRFAREQGYVETALGRRRYIPELNQSNFHVRQAAERMAINMPVQGTAADIIKIAMANIHRRMKEKKVGSRMLLQVHDELIFEVPPGEMELMKDMVAELMPAALELVVPLKVELKIGPTWGDLG